MKLITRLSILLLIFAYVFLTNVEHITSAYAPTVYAYDVKSEVWTEADTIDLIHKKSLEYGVNYNVIKDIVNCETGGDIASTTIQSRHYYKGQQERSFGLVQINLPSWNDITYEQATDPHFAIDFLAKKLKENRGYLWTCYSLI